MGVWTHENGSIRPSSVLFHADQLYKALVETTATTASDPAEESFVQKISYDILKFLNKLVRASKCYPALCDFSGFFTKLMPLCGDKLEDRVQAECELIEALVAIGPSKDDIPAFDPFSIFVANPFCLGEGYISFVTHRAEHVFEAARLEPCNERRLEMRKRLRLLDSSLSSSAIAERETAIGLFNEESSFADRAKLMVSTGLQHAAGIAIAWGLCGTMGCTGLLFQEASPSFKKIQFDN